MFKNCQQFRLKQRVQCGLALVHTGGISLKEEHMPMDRQQQGTFTFSKAWASENPAGRWTKPEAEPGSLGFLPKTLHSHPLVSSGAYHFRCFSKNLRRSREAGDHPEKSSKKAMAKSCKPHADRGRKTRHFLCQTRHKLVSPAKQSLRVPWYLLRRGLTPKNHLSLHLLRRCRRTREWQVRNYREPLPLLPSLRREALAVMPWDRKSTECNQ